MAAARSMSASRSRGSSIWPWLGLAVIIVINDQFTKTLILGYYKLGDATYVTSFFNVSTPRSISRRSCCSAA